MTETESTDPDVCRATPTDAPPEEHHHPEHLRRADSLVLVHPGNGKGTSSAAFGVMIRSIARGWPVAVVQFLKSGNWAVGEEKIAQQLGVDWVAMGEGFTWDSEDLTQDEAVSREAWRLAGELIAKGDHRRVSFDEITYPMNWGWIDTADVVAAIRDRSPKTNVVCTGRDAPAELIDIADTVTEMNVVKHAYESGIRAMKGIDY